MDKQLPNSVGLESGGDAEVGSNLGFISGSKSEVTITPSTQESSGIVSREGAISSPQSSPEVLPITDGAEDRVRLLKEEEEALSLLDVLFLRKVRALAFDFSGLLFKCGESFSKEANVLGIFGNHLDALIKSKCPTDQNDNNDFSEVVSKEVPDSIHRGDAANIVSPLDQPNRILKSLHNKE